MDIQTNFTIEKKVTGVEFKSLSVVKHLDGTAAFITFNLLFEDESSEMKEIRLHGEKFNEFWSGFDNTSKMYELLFNEMNQPFTPSSNMDETIMNDSVE